MRILKRVVRWKGEYCFRGRGRRPKEAEDGERRRVGGVPTLKARRLDHAERRKKMHSVEAGCSHRAGSHDRIAFDQKRRNQTAIGTLPRLFQAK